MYGKILAFNRVNGRGIIECHLDNCTYQFTAKEVLAEDRQYIKNGLNVQFETSGRNAVDIETVSGSYKRFNDSVREERTAKTIKLDLNDWE